MPRYKTQRWDEKPLFADYNGFTVEFFTRTALAKALNRQVVTIRDLEYKNILCHPKIKHGARGWWLYTRDQIEDLILLAKEEKVFDPYTRNYYSTRFIKEAHEILKRSPRK